MKNVPVQKRRAVAPAGASRTEIRVCRGVFLLFITMPFPGLKSAPSTPRLVFIFRHHRMLLLSGGPKMFGSGGTLSCAAFPPGLCDSPGLGFATPKIPLFVCGSAPHTPEDGRPTPCGSHIFSSSAASLSLFDSLGLGLATSKIPPLSVEALCTFVRPQRPCPRTPTAPSASAKFNPK